MICNFCLEDKDISEFYVSGINKINRNCKNCTQIINTKSRIKKKNVEIQVLNNKHTQIKINKKYWITANSTKAKKESS